MKLILAQVGQLSSSFDTIAAIFIVKNPGHDRADLDSLRQIGFHGHRRRAAGVEHMLGAQHTLEAVVPQTEIDRPQIDPALGGPGVEARVVGLHLAIDALRDVDARPAQQAIAAGGQDGQADGCLLYTSRCV